MTIGAVAVIAIVTASLGSFIWETVDADEIVLIRSPIKGTMNWHTSAGMKFQGFGKVTSYPRRMSYDFANRIRFNEGGHGTMHGSIQWEMPLDELNLTRLHERFSSAEAIQAQLIKVVTDKSVYMTGPLLSSTESYAEKRTNLINWVEDQIVRGIYQTSQTDVRVTDILTGDETTVTVVEIVRDDSGQPLRQENAQLTEFGIRPFNFAVTQITYDDAVEQQIQNQQRNIMQVQTAIAESREAEQRALTVAQQGEANAAAAKWEQEVLKARQVTAAEQALAVAELDRQTADQERQANILRGQGEAERKRLVMAADGALDQKLAALVEINKAYAEAIQNYKGNWVPSVVTGGGGSSTVAGGGAQELIEMLKVRVAQELAVDANATGTTRTSGNF